LDINPVPITEEIHLEKQREDPKGNRIKEMALEPSQAAMIKLLQ